MWTYSYDKVVSTGRRASNGAGWPATRAGGKSGGGDTRWGRRPVNVGGDTWVRARDVWEEAGMWEGAVKGGSSSGGMEWGGGRSAQVSSTERVGGTYHERWGCMDRGRGRLGGGWNTGGGCQGWQGQHVQGSGNLSLWLGTCESGARAGDAWVAGEKAWVGPGSVGRGMRPCRRASLSWLVMGHVPCDTCVTHHWRCRWQGLASGSHCICKHET